MKSNLFNDNNRYFQDLHTCKKFSSGGDNNPQLIVPLTTPDLNPELALEVLHQQVKRPGAHAEFEVW